jgi:plastocyanin
MDNGNTWSVVTADPHPSSPSDSEAASCSFAVVGMATLRAVATDTGGQTATATQTVVVSKASQGAVAISPASSAVIAGQSVAFLATGGLTGNYVWTGSAAGTGPVQTVAFPVPGSYAVTVVDSGDASYNPSGPASAAVTVQNAFYTLSISTSGAGSVSGGGSYPPNSQAVASAAAGPGSAFTGWTGDVTAASPSISILMSANRSVMAHFSALAPQSISYVPPGAVSTRTPPFALAVAASSGLPVQLALNSGPATLNGDTITPSGTLGEVTLTATQPGNAQYLPAQPVVITFSIGPPPPGVVLKDDSAATKKSDKDTRSTSFTSEGKD